MFRMKWLSHSIFPFPLLPERQVTTRVAGHGCAGSFHGDPQARPPHCQRGMAVLLPSSLGVRMVPPVQSPPSEPLTRVEPFALGPS